MRTLLMLVLLAGSGSHPNGAKCDTIAISADYKIEITDMPIVPKFLSGFFANILQSVKILPDSISYSEIITEGKIEDPFRMQAIDPGNDEWIRVFSDTSETSFVQPPLSKKDTLSPGGVRFVSRLREFFREPWIDTLKTSFPFKKGTLRVSVYRDTAAKPEAAYSAYHPSLFRFRSEDGRGKPYLDCNIWVGWSEEVVIYPQIEAKAYEKKVELVVSMKRLKITRK